MQNADALRRAVDGARYPAKDSGRNRVAVDEALALAVGEPGCCAPTRFDRTHAAAAAGSWPAMCRTIVRMASCDTPYSTAKWRRLV